MPDLGKKNPQPTKAISDSVKKRRKCFKNAAFQERLLFLGIFNWQILRLGTKKYFSLSFLLIFQKFSQEKTKNLGKNSSFFGSKQPRFPSLKLPQNSQLFSGDSFAVMSPSIFDLTQHHDWSLSPHVSLKLLPQCVVTVVQCSDC